MKPEDNPTVIIDCKHAGWDNFLYDNLWGAAPIELRNLHGSYESFMRQLAEMSSREFILHPRENKGEFTRRTRK